MKVADFKNILTGGHIYRHLYHFTDVANLPSIAEHGILSKHESNKRNILVSVPGGNEWSRNADTLKGLDDYVNLCFTISHPMCYIAQSEGRVPNPQYLAIDADVLLTTGVRITLGVANRASTMLLTVEDGLENLDKEVLYTRMDWGNPQIQARLKNAEKCEVLVPTIVPVDLLRTVI